MRSRERFVLSLCAQTGSVRTKVRAELLTSALTATEFGISLISATSYYAF